MDPANLDREALHRLFFEESEEGFRAMEQALRALEEAPLDAEPLNTLVRVAHTLKGNAGSLGFTDLGMMAHGLEDVLDGLRSGSHRVTRDVVELLFESVNLLREGLLEAKGSLTRARAAAQIRGRRSIVRRIAFPRSSRTE